MPIQPNYESEPPPPSPPFQTSEPEVPTHPNPNSESSHSNLRKRKPIMRHLLLPFILALTACGSPDPGRVTFTCFGETSTSYANPDDPLVDIEATFNEGWILAEDEIGTVLVSPNGECMLTGELTSSSAGVSFYRLDTPALCERSDPTLGTVTWIVADGSNAQVIGPQLRVELFGALESPSIGRQPGVVRFDGRCE